MPETPTPGPERTARVREALAKSYQRTRDGVRDGLLDARAATLEVPPRSEHARTFVFAVLLPFNLLRLTWRDEGLRARFVARLRAPFAMLFGMAFLLALHVARLLPGPVDKVVGGIGGALRGAYEVAQNVMPSPLALFGGGDDDDDDDKSHARAHGARAREIAKKLRGRAPVAARAARDERIEHERNGEGAEGAESDESEDQADASVAEELASAKGEVDEALGQVALALASTDGLLGDGGVVTLTGSTGEHLAAVNAARDALGDKDERSKESNERRQRNQHKDKDAWDILSFAGALLALEWILVWIGREHHDLIAHDVSRLAGIPVEALKRPPKLRCDVGYLTTKGWRAFRYVLFVALALPPAGLAVAVVKIACWIARASFLGPALATVTVLLVGVVAIVYWSAVFGAANAFVAWDPPPPGWAPWFMRGLAPLGGIPGVGWIVRLYSRLVWRATRNVWPACYAFELAPLESIAMTAGKLVAVVPGVYLLLRPFFGPAATHLIVARRRRQAPVGPPEPGPLTAPPAA